MDGSLAQGLGKGIQHFGKVLIEFGFSLVIFVDGLKDVIGDSMGILGVKIRFEVSEVDKVSMANSDESINCHEKHSFDGF